MEVLWQRKSDRTFSDKKLSDKKLSNLLLLGRGIDYQIIRPAFCRRLCTWHHTFCIERSFEKAL